MPRKNLIRTNEFYYHITTRANHKDWFCLPMEEVWEISCYAMARALEKHPAMISQFVLMNNHYHMLILTPHADIDKFMYFFNKQLSEELRRKSKKINRMFGSNYKWSIIKNQKYFFNVFRYIYQNPIRANIVTKCENYPFSTHHYYYYRKLLPFKFSPINDYEEMKDILNENIDIEQNEVIKSGLKNSHFKPVFKRKY